MWPEGLCGVEFKVEGFSHKLPLLVASVTQQLVRLQVLPAPLPFEPCRVVTDCTDCGAQPSLCCCFPMPLLVMHLYKTPRRLVRVYIGLFKITWALSSVQALFA